MAGKLAESWIKFDRTVASKLALKVDQQLIKGSLWSWSKVDQSCTKVNRKLIQVGFGSWSNVGSQSWPKDNQR